MWPIDDGPRETARPCAPTAAAAAAVVVVMAVAVVALAVAMAVVAVEVEVAAAVVVGINAWESAVGGRCGCRGWRMQQ